MLRAGQRAYGTRLLTAVNRPERPNGGREVPSRSAGRLISGTENARRSYEWARRLPAAARVTRQAMPLRRHYAGPFRRRLHSGHMDAADLRELQTPIGRSAGTTRRPLAPDDGSRRSRTRVSNP